MSRKAVFDAIVFLQAGANPAGPTGACLAHVRAGSITLITSPEIIAELRGLLARPDIRKKLPHLSQVDVLLAALCHSFDPTLLASDKDFDAVPDLRGENWLT